MVIRIFVTGGTFDNSYNELTGAMVSHTFVSSDGLFNLGSAMRSPNSSLYFAFQP